MAFHPWTLTLPCPTCGADLTFEVCGEPDPDVGLFGYTVLFIGHADGGEPHKFTPAEVEALEDQASTRAMHNPNSLIRASMRQARARLRAEDPPSYAESERAARRFWRHHGQPRIARIPFFWWPRRGVLSLNVYGRGSRGRAERPEK